VGFIVGGVGVAAGAILWIALPSTTVRASTASISPYVGPSAVGVVGRF
jgi:hypothetical protein